MQPVEVQTLVNGELRSVVMPPLQGAAGGETPTLVPGPDVIVGDLPEMAQYGSNGIFVGLGIGTTSCNNGDQPLHWFALPQTDHPVIPQNFYRMSGGTNNNDRFEQIGQSWLKHAFLALEDNACNFGCNTSGCTTGSNLCPGCSDPYGSSLNASQDGNWLTRVGEPIYGNLPIDGQQSQRPQSHWHIAPGYSGNERSGSIAKSGCDLFRRSAICDSERILMVPVPSRGMQHV